jgi:hypothetical protein
MTNNSTRRRLHPTELVVGGLVGAISPYLVSFLVQIGPEKVPLWIVFVGGILGFLLATYLPLANNAWEARRAKKRSGPPDVGEVVDRLARLERAVGEVAERLPSIASDRDGTGRSRGQRFPP